MINDLLRYNVFYNEERKTWGVEWWNSREMKYQFLYENIQHETEAYHLANTLSYMECNKIKEAKLSV